MQIAHMPDIEKTGPAGGSPTNKESKGDSKSVGAGQGSSGRAKEVKGDDEGDGEGNTFKPDYRIAGLSALGFAGLLFGLILMSYQGCGILSKTPSISAFHEVNYSPRALIGQTLDSLTDSLHKVIVVNQAKIDAIKPQPKGGGDDSTAKANEELKVKLKGKKDEDSSTILELNGMKSYYGDASLTDSIALSKINSQLRFQVTPDMLVGWNDRFEAEGYAWNIQVNYWAKIPISNSRFLTRCDVACFKIENYPSNMQYMARYPQSGTWVFLVAIFCAFCFIALPTSILLQGRVFAIFKDDIKKPSSRGFYITFAIIFLSLVALYFISKVGFDDEMPVKSLFFMKGFKFVRDLVNLLGYVAGAFCLTGFIYTAAMLSHFGKKMKDTAKLVISQRALVRQSDATAKSLVGGAPPTNTVEHQDLNAMEAKQEDQQATFAQLLGFFNRYFLLSSVILSLMVLCTGSLYGMVNSLDFIRMLSSEWGYSPARTDIVYLYGGVYTVILLLIYLPAKARFSEIQASLPPADPAAGKASPAADDGLIDAVKDPFSKLQGTLVAASPLLAGIIQSLLSLLFKH
jgi:hypothetical protein